MDIKLDDRHTITAAKTILSDGHEIELEAKPESNTGLARCHFFPTLKHGEFEIRLRMDWGDLSGQGDPTLDADITKNGKALKKKEQWHHTTKQSQNGVYLYVWKPEIEGIESIQISFKLQTTNQKTQTGKTRIAPPSTSV